MYIVLEIDRKCFKRSVHIIRNIFLYNTNKYINVVVRTAFLLQPKKIPAFSIFCFGTI